MHDDLKAAVTADMPRLKTLLADLVRMKSVGAPGYDPVPVRQTAETLKALLEEAGLENAQLLDGGGHPAVFAERPAPEGAPTLLLYAHYDVQPPGPAEAWETAPFEPFEKNGRLYGRGAADDKSGVVMHLGAVAAHGNDLPVGIQVFFEGEEESGSPTLPAILDRYSDLIQPDIIVIGDGGNWEVGKPAFLTSLRGIAAVTLELRTLEEPLHSGQFGGPLPDAITTLARLLSSLVDERGNVAIEGLTVPEEEPNVEVPAAMLRAQAKPVEGLELIGTGSIAARLWTRPAISVLALDAPPTAEAINQLVPVARAKVSLRIPPGQDSTEALELLKSHLREHTPWEARIDFLQEETGEATTLDLDNPAVEAWSKAFREAYGTDPVAVGAGGSIPFIAEFAHRYPEAPILVIGVGDPTSNIHAPNESVDLGDLERATASEAIALRLLSSG
ncbi:MAG: dipeptidase [Acidimicrobiia bacterium]